MSSAADRVPLREVVRLAGPALPVLAAEPLYLLIDTAVVGRLGAVPLAGLAVAGVVFAQVTGQLNFLSYGTTARAAPPAPCTTNRRRRGSTPTSRSDSMKPAPSVL